MTKLSWKSSEKAQDCTIKASETPELLQIVSYFAADRPTSVTPESCKKAEIGAFGDHSLLKTRSGIQARPVTNALKYAQITRFDPFDQNRIRIKKQENSGMGARAEVDTLTEQHASLDAFIAEENQRPHPDFLKISELKREKLRLKEQIEQTYSH